MRYSFYFFSIITNKNNALIQKNSNNLKTFIDDSINPTCQVLNNSELDKSLISFNQIEIKIPKSREWSKNLITAKISNSVNVITDKYKKKFNAFVLVKNSDNEICELRAKVRLSGDAKDHITFVENDIAASLDVKLQEGSINGIVRFKLFLPETRNNYSELITVALLQEMGYLAPRTRLIDTTINGSKIKMIMQEKASKEMLENNYLRESAIVGSDESLMWRLRAKDITKSFNSLLHPRIINFNWYNKSFVNREIALKGIKTLSRAIQESWDVSDGNIDNTFSDLLLANGNQIRKKFLSKFRAHLLAIGGEHALANHNRRFYYDAFNDHLLPIYYDGNVLIDHKRPSYFEEKFRSNIQGKNQSLLRELTINDINESIVELSNINPSILHQKLNFSGVP